MITYARVWFVVFLFLENTHEVSFPFEILYAALTAHFLTKSIPWLRAKYFSQLACNNRQQQDQ